LLVLSACSLGSQPAPSLTGPSTFGLSISVSASPDLMSRDGSAQSTVTVVARDANSQPVRNLALRLDVTVGGVLGDLGTLSSRNISTNTEGRASVIYTAPPPAPFGAPNEATIQIFATPIGTDFSNSISTGVSIRLASPGIIQPPNGAPVPNFFFSPTSPHERENVIFDASASTDPDGKIVSYQWNFGDSTGATSAGPTTTHLYGVSAAYQVTVTVTDDRGLSVTSAPKQVTVLAATNPVASFVNSPTNPLVLETVTFNGSASSVPPGRQIQSWTWDFGDGTSATTSGPTTSHVYTLAKTYTVTLTVTDDIGRTNTISRTLTINP
jgi:PKD repeat protein